MNKQASSDELCRTLRKRCGHDSHSVDGCLNCEAADQIEEHEQSFNLRWKADMRAIRRWQEAHPGNDLTWPDHADLCVWLLEQLETKAIPEPGADQLAASDAMDYESGVVRVTSDGSCEHVPHQDVYMPASESPVTQQEIVSAIHHHACELARLTETWPAHEPRADLPKPINHDLWRHLHDEHGLTLLQSELDEIVRLAQPPVLEWQPIETAPKDGRSFLAVRGGSPFICRWGSGANIWQQDSGEWRDPKYWMPLPSGPTKEPSLRDKLCAPCKGSGITTATDEQGRLWPSGKCSVCDGSGLASGEGGPCSCGVGAARMPHDIACPQREPI
jgi:hypothetical protein